MNYKPYALILAASLAMTGSPAAAAGESPSNPSLIGILYKQFDAIKNLFVEHQARVQAKLDQFEKALAAPSPNALDRVKTGVTTHDWKAYAGDALDKAFDQDPETATGWSQTATNTNVGFYQIDLGEKHRGIAKVKVGIAAANDKYEVYYSIQASDDGIVWGTIWQTEVIRIPGERVIEPGFAFNGRWLRFRAHDIGRGAAMARIYDIQITSVK